MRLKGKTALITGASRNIGRQIALTFAREGADLVLNTRQSVDLLTSLSEECKQLGAKTVSVLGDVANPEEAEFIVQQGLSELGQIDIFISNVAIRPHLPFLDISNDHWQLVMNNNLNAAFYLLKAILPSMIEQSKGSIIVIGGQAAISGRPYTAAVSASKTGLLGLVRAIAAEMGPHNIRANMINPGTTDTERRHPEWYPEDGKKYQKKPNRFEEIPLKRLATTQDIANACLFLASDDAAYITGEQLNVVGGRLMI